MKLTRHLKTKLITGFLVVIPLLVTIYIVYAVISFADRLAAPLMKGLSFQISGTEWYLPGTGVVLFIVFVYVAGLISSNYLGTRLIIFGEGLLHRIPFVKSIYSSVKDMTEAFSSEKKRSFKDVVLVQFPSPGRYALGFVVDRIQVSSLPAMCSVFVPTAPNPTSGYLIMVPDSELSFLDMGVDDALKYIISIGTARTSAQWKEKRSG